MNTALDKYDNAIYVLHLTSNVLSSIMRHPPKATFFPYTTLFRSPRSRFPRLAVPRPVRAGPPRRGACDQDRKSTRLNSSHVAISYAVFCLKKKKMMHSRSYKFYSNE